MPLNPRWRKALRITAITTGILLLAAFAFVQIQQHILRWRAEQLLSDIRNLELGKSTWADTQKIMTRWGAWGFYEGTCADTHCNYQIAMQDMYQGFPIYSAPSMTMRNSWHTSSWKLMPYELMGGRPALVSARVEVIRGVVWAKDYQVSVTTLPRFLPSDSDYILIASASTVWRTADFHRPYMPSHPEYIISRPGGCTFCVLGYLKFTPFADAADVNRLMDFNLKCLTLISYCRDRMDIMPTAWKQNVEEEKQTEASAEAVSNDSAMTPSLEFLGRDRANIVVAEVVSTRTEKDRFGETNFATIRTDQRIKNAVFLKPQKLEEIYATAKLISLVSAGKSKPANLGNKVILAFNTPYQISPLRPMDMENYEALSMTDKNLDAIRKGMALDIFPEANPKFPLSVPY